MAKHSGSRDKSGTDIRGISNSERGRESGSGSGPGSNMHSGSLPGRSSTQMSSSQSKSSTRGSGSGSQMNSPHGERRSDDMGPQHTNAGNTGFSSDQISPKTQNLPQTGPSASHPGRGKGSHDRNS